MGLMAKEEGGGSAVLQNRQKAWGGNISLINTHRAIRN